MISLLAPKIAEGHRKPEGWSRAAGVAAFLPMRAASSPKTPKAASEAACTLPPRPPLVRHLQIPQVGQGVIVEAGRL